MKRALLLFLVFLTLFIPAAAAHGEGVPERQRPVSLLVLFTLDKKLPASGKTFTMAHYIATFDEENDVVRFTTLPYNLAVNVTAKGVTKQKQLMAVCKESGVDAAVEAIRQNFGITVDYWIMTNFMTVPGMVDAIGGVTVDIPDLSINGQGKYVKSLVGKPWEEVTVTGPQTLSGVQAVGYLVDTTYGNPTIEEEELRFRERQENFTREIIGGMKNLHLTLDGLIDVTEGAMKGYYMTNIDLKGLFRLARIDIACFDNEPQYLHIPRQIFTVKASNGWDSLGYTPEDAEAARLFTGQ